MTERTDVHFGTFADNGVGHEPFGFYVMGQSSINRHNTLPNPTLIGYNVGHFLKNRTLLSYSILIDY